MNLQYKFKKGYEWNSFFTARVKRAWKRLPSLAYSPPSSIPKTHTDLVPKNLRQKEIV